MANLFKGKFVICIYELNGDETCVAQFDNVRQLAKFINKSEKYAGAIARYHFRNKNVDRPRIINVNNENYEIDFVEM